MASHSFESLVRNAVDRIASTLNGLSNGPLHAHRRAALEAFATTGVPTPRSEEWKYTNVAPFIGLEYGTVPSADESVTASAIREVFAPLGEVLEGGWHAVIVDGVFRPSLSCLPSAEAGVECSVISDASAADVANFSELFGTLAPAESSPFAAVNTAVTSGGLLIRLRAGAQVTRPLHVAVVTTVQTEHRLSCPRIMVVAGENSSADIIESHHSIGPNTALDVTVTEVHGAPSSHIRYYKLVDDGVAIRHIGYTGASVYRGGTFTAHSVNLGGAFVRNNLAVKLLEPSAEAFLYGVSSLGGQEYADNHTVVDHIAPHCHSEELYKGVYDGTSIGVFNGKIYVRPQAQKTTAYQSSRAILLSERAQMNAKPQLEIWADDVKCSHGATTGQLDEEALFYMRSRGLDEANAKAFLTYAFLADVAQHINLSSLREYVEQRLAAKIGFTLFAE